AHSLGLAVVAEGVETEAQHLFLVQGSCDGFQGYLYAAPCSAEKIATLLGRQDCAAPASASRETSPC
ncbi:MAG: hypothetical protein JWP29_1309, partial [Rhodoferax sp.]|nr:hypothetical protein [Rhodoferax sp.]